MNTIGTLADAQRDMRSGYLAGAPGVLASALAWMVAAIVVLAASPRAGVLALFIGGMGIFPVGVAIARMFGRSGTHTPGNPLAPLALESTVLMMLCLPLAFVVSLYRVEYFFPAMLLVIGGRYLLFATLYGLRIYWALGGTLAVAAVTLGMTSAPTFAGAMTGALIELSFAVVMLVAGRKW